MKQLLTLISLFFIISVNSQTITYTIKQGDTLYSIAKDNNVSINKIFNANENLGFSPDQIFAGNKIFLPQKKTNIYDAICHSRIGLIQLNLYKSTKKIIDECINKLSPYVDKDNFDPKDLSYEEILYLVNKILYEYDYSIAKKEIDLLLDSAKHGNLTSARSLARLGVDYFFENIKNLDAQNIVNNDLPFNERKQSCNNFLFEKPYEKYDLLISFYLRCSDMLFENADNNFIKFDNALIDLILSSGSQIIKMWDLYAITSISYRKINSSDAKSAYEVTNKFIKLKCPDCNDSIDLFNKYVDAQDSSEYSQDLNNGLYYLVLNNTSSGYEIKGITPESIIEDREPIIKRLKKRKNQDKENRYDYQSTYADYLSDTALKLMNWQECNLASNYLDLAIQEYQSDGFDNSFGDYFIEPLYLSICFSNKISLSDSSSKYSDMKDLLKAAKKYLDISLVAKDELNINNPIKIALLNIQEIIYEIQKETLRDDESNKMIYLSKEYSDKLINISSTLKETEIYDFSGDIENFELISSLYLALYTDLDKKGWTEMEALIDPVSLFQMKNKFSINSRLTNLKAENTNLNLKNQQRKLVENNKKIKNLSDQVEYKELLKIYKENSNLIEEIFSLNKNLEKLSIGNIDSIKSIQATLNENEYAYLYIPSTFSSRILLISNKDYKYWNRIAYVLLKPVIDEFKDSINPNEDYDFELAKFLGDSLFPMIDKNENFINKGSTIYIYTDNLIGLPPGILLQSYDDSPNISEYERILSANWFIKDYNFTTKLNYSSYEENSIDAKPFLGIGNSTSYNWVGLPNLKEVNAEITNLALTSFATKDNILLNKQATKEIFLKKLEDNYERVVISTHSVPPNWQGLIEEPALVFNSNVGDYFLTPTEIINKNFKSEMVVLSSCNASIEGFDDLYKSFLIAGSKSVVHSNWNLESRYAKEFTTSFFKELWLGNKSKHEVIRDVSLSFINNYSNQAYSHPAYWGNFSIVYSSLN